MSDEEQVVAEISPAPEPEATAAPESETSTLSLQRSQQFSGRAILTHHLLTNNQHHCNNKTNRLAG